MVLGILSQFRQDLGDAGIRLEVGGISAISTRLKLARREMSYKKKYDYTVVNDRLDAAYKKLKDIVASQN